VGLKLTYLVVMGTVYIRKVGRNNYVIPIISGKLPVAETENRKYACLNSVYKHEPYERKYYFDILTILCISFISLIGKHTDMYRTHKRRMC
jgi:hypothetical protein